MTDSSSPMPPFEVPVIPQTSGETSATTLSTVPQQTGTGLPRWIPWSFAALGTVIVVLVLAVVAASNSGGSTNPEAKPSTAATLPTRTTAAPTTAAPPPVVTYYSPTKSDFELGVKILRKQCFGSAGCNITYRIDVTYTGGQLDPYKTYEVTYEVKGAEDPIVDTLEVTGDSASVQQEEMASTRRSSDKLTAVVTEVSEL